MTNGDDGTPVEVTGTSGVEDLTFCGRPGWDPREAVDLVGTTYTGEAEDVRGRTLARYDGDGADRAVDRLRDAVEACPEEEVGGTAQVYDLMPGDAGDDSFVVTHRYRGDAGFDTGLEVIEARRLDDLLLLSFEYGEGGGSAASISRSVREVGDGVNALVPELCEYAAHPCSVREPSPVVGIGPDGVEDITLGMSEEAAAAVGLVRTGPGDGGCTTTYRDDPSGTYAVMAEVRTGVGVVSVWATTISRTPEDVGYGSSPDELVAAYPDATGDGSHWTARVPGHPDRTYSFVVGPDHLVTDVDLRLTEQPCDG
jgi:hypothetical protein